LRAWLHSPFDRTGWIAWLIWCVPAAVQAFRASPTCLAWFPAGVFVSLVGFIGDFHFLEQAGLATVSAGFLSQCRIVWVWLAAAISWMPVFGWAFSFAGTSMVCAGRVVLAVAAAGLTFRFLR
jgi:hypothetical protein